MRHFLLPFALLLSVSLAAQVPSYVPTDGLVAWYPFNGNANDESGNGNNGSVSGASITSDRNGNQSAFHFNGNEIRSTYHIPLPYLQRKRSL